MTVEAGIAIPLFLFAVLNLLSIILLFGEYSSNLADMHREAKELSVHAHILGEETFSGNEMVTLKKIQKLDPVIPVMGFNGSTTMVTCRIRKWTGYDVSCLKGSEEEEEWVYITPNGEAYHRNRNCSYLNPKILSAVTADIDYYRNKDGEKYRICGSCKSGSLTGICFYTVYGNRYHTTLQCSSLRRTIETVKLSEVGGRHICGKCSEEE